MRQVFSSPNSMQVGLAQSILEAANIPCEIRNDAVSRVEVGFPFMQELWVLRDEDYDEARALIAKPSP